MLDTNIISNVTKPIPSESLVAWMGKQVDEDLFIASLTVAEIRRGVLEKPAESGVISLRPGLAAQMGRRHCSRAVFFPSTRRRR